jgi:hypothetical protein
LDEAMEQAAINYSINDVIIESHRDQQSLLYLINVLGEEAIVKTIAGFTGGKRYYVSNIAKKNKIEIPERAYIQTVSKDEALKRIEKLKQMLDNAHK